MEGRESRFINPLSSVRSSFVEAGSAAGVSVGPSSCSGSTGVSAFSFVSVTGLTVLVPLTTFSFLSFSSLPAGVSSSLSAPLSVVASVSASFFFSPESFKEQPVNTFDVTKMMVKQITGRIPRFIFPAFIIFTILFLNVRRPSFRLVDSS